MYLSSLCPFWGFFLYIYTSNMYFTTNPVIKTNDPALAWMNDTIFVGKMQRNTMAGANGQGHLVYDIYKVV